MTNTAPIAGDSAARRDYSVVEKRLVGGQLVYVKHCLPGCRYETPELVRSQLEREVALLDHLATQSDFGSRLGLVQVLDHDAASSRLTTSAVPGQLLTDVLHTASTAARRGRCTRAVLLAGSWSRALQRAPLEIATHPHTPSNPQDLVTHCELRLEAVRDAGYAWPDAEQKDRLLGWLREQLKATPAKLRARVWCHGDFGPYNLMWDDRKLTPIDFSSSAADLPLADVTYLIHRLQMLPLRFPWRAWPIGLWTRACLRGYGLPEAQQLPIYRVLMVRHLLSRLKKLVQREPESRGQAVFHRWSRRWVRMRLRQLVETLD